MYVNNYVCMQISAENCDIQLTDRKNLIETLRVIWKSQLEFSSQYLSQFHCSWDLSCYSFKYLPYKIKISTLKVLKVMIFFFKNEKMIFFWARTCPTATFRALPLFRVGDVTKNYYFFVSRCV